jgi:hypothetical protein
MSEPTRHQAKASITVLGWNPLPYEEPAAGPSLVRIDVEESFTGDLEGAGVATMLQVLRPDGSASFCALERVTGALAGQAGTFVLQDAGELAADGRVAGRWFVVPGASAYLRHERLGLLGSHERRSASGLGSTLTLITPALVLGSLGGPSPESSGRLRNNGNKMATYCHFIIHLRHLGVKGMLIATVMPKERERQ